MEQYKMIGNYSPATNYRARLFGLDDLHNLQCLMRAYGVDELEVLRHGIRDADALPYLQTSRTDLENAAVEAGVMLSFVDWMDQGGHRENAALQGYKEYFDDFFEEYKIALNAQGACVLQMNLERVHNLGYLIVYISNEIDEVAYDVEGFDCDCDVPFILKKLFADAKLPGEEDWKQFLQYYVENAPDLAPSGGSNLPQSLQQSQNNFNLPLVRVVDPDDHILTMAPGKGIIGCVPKDSLHQFIVRLASLAGYPDNEAMPINNKDGKLVPNV